MPQVALADGFLDVPEELLDLAETRIPTRLDPGWRPLTIKEFERLAAPVSKHMGPGPHPSGSSQKEHGRTGTAHAEPLLHIQRGEGTLKGEPVAKYITDADGQELLFSYDALDQAGGMMVNGELKSLNAKKVTELKNKIKATLMKYDLDPGAIDANLSRLMDSAIERYRLDPDLIDQDRFYQLWHYAYAELDEEIDLPGEAPDFERMVAAGAVISPGTDAVNNLQYAHDLARTIALDPSWSGAELEDLTAYLADAGYNTLNPVYLGKEVAVRRGEAKKGDPKPPPKPGEAQYEKGHRLLDAAEKLNKLKSVRLSKLDDDIAARAIGFYRVTEGSPGAILGDVGQIYAESIISGESYKLSPNSMFQLKNWDYYSDAVAVLRCTKTPDQVLGDVKTRSFYNNTIDFTDFANRADVTVDFHTVNFSFFVLGADKLSSLNTTPKFEGVGLGVRPLAADAIRRLITRASAALGEDLTASRVQEILWAEWQRGMTTSGGKEFTHWTSATGEMYELRRLTGKSDEDE